MVEKVEKNAGLGVNGHYRVVTLGCRTNQYESQAYVSQLQALGFQPAVADEPVSLCIVNTCTVTGAAERDSRREIRKLLEKHPDAQVVVTGCAVEADPGFAREFAGRVHLVPNQQKERLIEQLFPHLTEFPEFQLRQFEEHTRAFVKVQDGCNSFCTYCIIPYTRGRSRSRPIPEILDEIRGLVARGYQEVVLTGINIGDFDGGGKGKRLSELIQEVDALEGIQRIRISSIDPDEIDDDLARVVLEGKYTCPSMHVVLQAGSNVVLKRMNRKYTRQIFLHTIQRLRQANPDFTFTTDIIVGFPGETEQDFEATLEVVRQVRFAKVHMFPYSKRLRTRAASYSDQVPPAVLHMRKDRLLREAEIAAFHLRNEYVGREMTVLTETREADSPGWIRGHTANFLPVMIESETLQANELTTVRLIANTGQGLIAYAA